MTPGENQHRAQVQRMRPHSFSIVANRSVGYEPMYGTCYRAHVAWPQRLFVQLGTVQAQVCGPRRAATDGGRASLACWQRHSACHASDSCHSGLAHRCWRLAKRADGKRRVWGSICPPGRVG